MHLRLVSNPGDQSRASDGWAGSDCLGRNLRCLLELSCSCFDHMDADRSSTEETARR